MILQILSLGNRDITVVKHLVSIPEVLGFIPGLVWGEGATTKELFFTACRNQINLQNHLAN